MNTVILKFGIFIPLRIQHHFTTFSRWNNAFVLIVRFRTCFSYISTSQ